MMYVPTSLGLASAAIISFLLLFIIACKIPRIRLKQGKLHEIRFLSLISLLYFFLWFAAIIVAESIFNLNLAPVMSTLAVFCIILPYVTVIILHIFGFTMKFSW